MSVKLSDLSEEERALLLQEAKETIGDNDSDKLYSVQVAYLDDAISAFVADTKTTRSIVSDKVRPFIHYLMKMRLIKKYKCPSNCQARAKTSEQLNDFKQIVDQVFRLMYDLILGGNQ